MKTDRPLIFFLILLFASLTAFLMRYPHDKASIVEDTRLVMGTVAQIKIPLAALDDRQAMELAVQKAFEEERRIEDKFSVYKPDSEISKINALAANQPLEIDDETFYLIAKSLEYARTTQGAFDITVKPLVDLWAQCKKESRLPTVEELDAARSRVGWRDVILNSRARTIMFRKDGMALDLGGIAKGYAADRAILVLKASGVENAIVNSSSAMYCLGRRSNMKQWKVGIQHPREREKIAFELYVKDRGVDTSGDYERYFILDGKRYSHIIDPRTGYPIGDNVVSATVIARDSMTADILATSLCVLGPEGLDMIKTAEGIDALLILKIGDAMKLETTKDFKKKYYVAQNTRL